MRYIPEPRRVIGAGYDDNGNLTSITPLGRPVHEFAYTPLNQESKYEPPMPDPTPQPAIANPATYFTYNDDGQMLTITRPDGAVISFDYDPTSGQLEHQVLPTGQGQIDYRYFPESATSGAGLQQYITAPDGGVLGYTYGGSLVFQETWDGTTPGTFSGSVEKAYDYHQRVAGLTVNSCTGVELASTESARSRQLMPPQAELVNLFIEPIWTAVHWANPAFFFFDADGFLTDAGDLDLARDPENGLLTGTTLGVVTDTYTRNDFGEVTGYTANVSAVPVLEVTYERDAGGRITKKEESLDGGAGVDTYYEYDPAGRLYRVCDDEPCSSIRAEYTYDLNSNRTGGFDEVSGAISATYDTQDRLLTYDGTTYTYTANGELTSKTDGAATTTYNYDALGNLRHVELPDGTDIDYVIDGKNRRIGKKVDGTLVQAFLYESQLRPVAELDANGDVLSRFVYGERINVPEYLVKGGTTYRIVHDHLGSPRRVINTTTGAVAQELTYDAFGNVLSDTSPGFQPFGFAGGLYDRDTGLVRFGARDYDPRAGRWTAKDPIGFGGGDLLLYGYASLDPINEFDPTGRIGFGGFGPGFVLLLHLMRVSSIFLAGTSVAAIGYACHPQLVATSVGGGAALAGSYYGFPARVLGYASSYAINVASAVLGAVAACVLAMAGY